jgi:hypothetical protein
VPVTVGAAGTQGNTQLPGPGTGLPGNAGGASSFGNLISANGGGAGNGGVNANGNNGANGNGVSPTGVALPSASVFPGNVGGRGTGGAVSTPGTGGQAGFVFVAF